MSENRQIKPIPWDRAAFGFDCFEISNPNPELLEKALKMPGHHTVKIDPLADKKPLHQYGFYYCDTLIEPWCTADRLIKFTHEDVSFSTTVSVESIVDICHQSFFYGRSHRDFNIDSKQADARY